jgi:hypothetical protein
VQHYVCSLGYVLRSTRFSCVLICCRWSCLYTIHTLAADPLNFNQIYNRAIYFDTRTFRPALHDMQQSFPT